MSLLLFVDLLIFRISVILSGKTFFTGEKMKEIAFILLMGMVGALIGWLTNVAALKLLFRPRRAYVVPLIGWKIQGLIPKRQRDIAVAIGDVVSTDLLTGNDIALSLARPEIKERIAGKVASHVQERVLMKIPPFIPRNIKIATLEYIGKSFRAEVISFFDNLQNIIKDESDIAREIKQIVEDKILALDLNKLEEMVTRLAKEELKHIEIIGGILGFIIGIAQGLLAVFIR
ncbi:DUF445 family protein [Thermanaerosceptrum fracticalcis]|uniref:DUF445 family protein n=1 Tax=Thermanaerosceptrum fracticalcis TaxID=1712410 RepID=A0A7G6DZK5_THEFR|nr:DUF445 family protein [Thermanaerosceptrum fracticalcis]QNB45259.1 DUF445 family protein [Thermanaerosceptrum fracticalcis]